MEGGNGKKRKFQRRVTSFIFGKIHKNSNLPFGVETFVNCSRLIKIHDFKYVRFCDDILLFLKKTEDFNNFILKKTRQIVLETTFDSYN